MPDIGEEAPDFTLPTDGDDTLTLSALRGAPTVLYFYPKDDTSGCTKQACGFTDAMTDFDALGVRVVGMSPDSVKRHDKFKAKYDLNFTLVSDEEKTTLERYGVWGEKSMYGRKYMGVERSTFLLDADGVVRSLWRKVKVPGHVDAVLQAAKDLKAG